MELKPLQIPLEFIEVLIGSEPARYYSGFAGSFATLADSCLRKKTLPGFYEEHLIAFAVLSDWELEVALSGSRTPADIIHMMDVTLENVSTFYLSQPIAAGKICFRVRVTSTLNPI